jgi:hypothetical protein
MEFFTIVKEKDWDKFSKDLIDFTFLNWAEGERIDDYNPFYNSYYGKCIIACVPEDGAIYKGDAIDREGELLSNDEFIQKAVGLHKKIKTNNSICCFVEKQVWKSFAEILELNKNINWVGKIIKPSEWYPFTNINENGVFIYAYNSELGIELCRSDIEDFDNEGELLTKTEFLKRVLIKEE